jgi:hypothetical protein
MFLKSRIFVIFLLATVFSVDAQTADEIVDKYIAAIGGREQISQIRSMMPPDVKGQQDLLYFGGAFIQLQGKRQ